MRLVDKFTLWFMGVFLLVTPITTFICYNNIEKKINDAETARLTDMNERVATQLKSGVNAEKEMKGLATEIVAIPTQLPAQRVQVEKEAADNNFQKYHENRLAVTSYYTINNKNYKISSYSYTPKAEQILSSILNTIVWKLVLMIFCLVISARLVSHRILRSLRITMKKIENFNVKRKLTFPHTGTRELRELNSFLQKMTDKAVEEYAAIKEFSENASHELQTPLAIIRSKLELLTETDIHEDQAALISDMQNAIEKLAKINRSLTLLAKLENKEYEVSESIRFCRVAKDVLAAYEDRIEMKNLSVKNNIDKNIQLKIHPTLADMLMNNLLGNAIRHNVQNGTINITLTQRQLIVSNTGLPPEIPTDELFQRFKKSNQCSESVGLGLSIVKQICEVSGFKVSYNYSNQLHVLEVEFYPSATKEYVAGTTSHQNFEPALS
ncbi:MAG TPA: HAMP domain-containing sensor histidine kinase [Chitinophaga sp.]|uniref:sensor histidine kinase n=1 Tax=Chitinophaga sp. TaxID=1869181 RepID=UPI002CE7A819|nr:HAMP domain-containing sensor histidine kinase [Chitinophaga sp.]HVI44659.1 HAMP domain-containing sensor histidine kinase [Chitinophaga sp.]